MATLENPRKGGWTGLIVLLVVCALVWSLYLIKKRGLGGLKRDSGSSTTAAPARSPAAAPKWTSTYEERQQRREAIRELQQKQVIGEIKVENGLGKIQIKPLFYQLPREERQMLCMVAAGWCLDKDPNGEGKIELIDSQSGIKVGEYSIVTGLEMK